MVLLEAILAANERATLAGSKPEPLSAGLDDALPLVALTCIDARLNRLLPEMLGVPEEQFVWLRNAGNIITGPMSSTMRSLGLACAVKGGKEIAIIGHSDCQVARSSTMQLLENFAKLGVERANLPENLAGFFGVFSSERQNVINACNIIRQSPIIGSKVPVHGLLIEVKSGRLEWLVNGYETCSSMASEFTKAVQAGADRAQAALGDMQEFKLGDMKFPETKIGEVTTRAGELLQKIGEIAAAHPQVDTPGQLAAEVAKDFVRHVIRTRNYKVLGDDHEQYGPISGEVLLQWIAEDRVDGQTLVQSEGSGEWKPLELLGKLVQQGVTPRLPPLLPPTGFKIKQRGGR
jgi:carbonic anhydrase